VKATQIWAVSQYLWTPDLRHKYFHVMRFWQPW